MFHFISGLLDEVGNDYAVIDCNGIGYRIYSSAKTISKLPSHGDKIKMYTYLHVKEDGLTLYGFGSKEELRTFLLLISVSGVGPKVALGILSSIDTHQLALAVIGEDIKMLTGCPGVGNKTAQRIILELKDKIKSDDAIIEQGGQVTVIQEDSLREAINALVVLGYNQNDAARAVAYISKGDKGQSTQQLIKSALKQLTTK